MREVHYHSWLSNPFMVKKHDNSWRMCVDFTNLNKSCPKDGYPLLEIDWKIESLYGYPFKCFLDTYKGYHQIQMVEEDEEKAAFHTNQGVYCYTKMLFSLKNVGATYQRLVDKAFKKKIGRNLEEDKHETESKEVHLRCRRRDVPRPYRQHERNQGMSIKSRSSNKVTIPKDVEGSAKPQWKTGKHE
ncbi:hypothetical protein Tco_0012286 [Tanacetum coccineum]